ncbi:PREDICTED: F-box protein At3g22700-like, partial [Camelina sativa]|uniref:F-box protein At3g22700-like n=1 Tax=Camelina sativa TaxID=90675 RepID=A0ABM1RHC5_CAMSA
MIISELPLDLLEEILSRIHATTLKSIRSTCKLWNSLLEDESFTKKHFRKAEKQSLVLLLKDYRFCSMNVAPPTIEFKAPLVLNDSYFNLKQVDILEVSHCDGLLLCTTKDDRLVVWNPCLGKTWWIQHKTGMRYCKLALGYVNNKSYHSYKILRFLEDRYVLKGAKVERSEIYEFSSGLWRILDEDVNDLDCLIISISVSLKGNSYWLAMDYKDSHILLLSFDFTTERFRRMCLSPFHYEGGMALSVVREENLSVLRVSLLTFKIEIWMTNKFDTEVALQWTNSFTLDIPDLYKVPPPFSSFVLDEEKKVALC